ncbi:MAG TPA: divergent polysaccharide deacetylase family protein, partial [Thermoanaerobaculia bacterium]
MAASDHVEPESATSKPATPIPPPPDGPVHGVRVALVIDDLGRSVEDLTPLEGLGVPVTYAVLPFQEQTPQVVAELRRRGAEILLHLPMEPKNGEDPGPGALLRGMGDEELREKTVAALNAVPGAVGVNNHMGSGLSAEEGPMKTVLGVLAARGLFFLDSRTSAESVGYKVARELGVPAAERQVFLDGEPTPSAIEAQFQRLFGLARLHGAAIAIGHPHPETLAALAREVPKAKAEGYEFVPVSYLLERAGDE